MFTFFFTEASPFSQWYRCSFRVGDHTFNCAEQYMMHGKALLFDDANTAAEILAADHPREHKALGRKVKNFDDAIWKRSREAIVLAGNRAKFTQSAELRAVLLETRGTTLVEASPYDKIWGIGLAATDPRAQDPAQWKGQNLLGKVLTSLRDELLACDSGTATP
ncbi:MAG: NADAR family protein [Kofleriaceae bacterium]